MKYYYKILSDNLKHNNMEYHLGLNIDIEDFDSQKKYGSGIYFSDKEYISNFLNIGTKIAKIYIPKNNEIIQVEEDKYKAHEIYIEEIHDINKEETIEWMIKEGININWEYISRCQYLSKDFIMKHIDDIDLNYLKYNENISNELYKEIKEQKEQDLEFE